MLYTGQSRTETSGAGQETRPTLRELIQIRWGAEEFHGDHERAAAADYGEFYDITDALLRDDAYQRVFTRNGLIIDRHDQIAADA